MNDSCAFNMHFVNWFWNRVTSGSIGGTNQEFAALESRVLDNMRKLYQPGVSHIVRTTCTPEFLLEPHDERLQTPVCRDDHRADHRAVSVNSRMELACEAPCHQP